MKLVSISLSRNLFRRSITRNYCGMLTLYSAFCLSNKRFRGIPFIQVPVYFNFRVLWPFSRETERHLGFVFRDHDRWSFILIPVLCSHEQGILQISTATGYPGSLALHSRWKIFFFFWFDQFHLISSYSKWWPLLLRSSWNPLHATTATLAAITSGLLIKVKKGITIVSYFGEVTASLFVVTLVKNLRLVHPQR